MLPSSYLNCKIEEVEVPGIAGHHIFVDESHADGRQTVC
jgi:hypothetical protein